MTIQEILDRFIADYKTELSKPDRKDYKELNFGKKYLFSLYTDAVHDLQFKLPFLETSQDIALISGTSDYDLNQDFARTKGKPKLNYTTLTDSIFIDEVNLDLLNQNSVSSSCPEAFAVYWDPDETVWKIRLSPTPSQSGTLTVFYFKSLSNYPGGELDLSVNFIYPEEFIRAVITHMLMVIFDDFEKKYLSQIDQLKSYINVNRKPVSMKYSIGGINWSR